MKIVVLVKQVPDTGSDRKLRDSDRTVDRDAAAPVFNEMDEHGVEEALRLKEAHGGEVTVLSMGPQQAGQTIRKALSMGADQAVHICDDALHGCCAVATGMVLAAALKKLDFDVVVAGTEASDARVGAVAGMLAEHLGIPALTGARSVSIDATTARIERQDDTGFQTIEADLPVVISVTEKINEPRYASFKGIMAAKKKPVQTWSVADLGLAPGDVGLAGATSEVVDFALRPPKEKGEIVADDGDGGVRLAEFLAVRKIV